MRRMPVLIALPPGRQRPQIRHVQVGQQDLAERSGDRRRRHQQDVRRAALRAQSLALGDAESMLLVDDRQGQVGELDRLLDQGVRSDDDPARWSGRAARRRPAARPAAPGRRGARRPAASRSAA